MNAGGNIQVICVHLRESAFIGDEF